MAFRRFALGFALVAIPVTALQAMTVAVFLEKAEALERRGVTALFSSDIRLLKAEAKSAGAALKAERDAARRAGRQPAFCPPEQGVRINANELLTFFRFIPPAQRQRMEVRDAMRLMMVRRYPCPA